MSGWRFAIVIEAFLWRTDKKMSEFVRAMTDPETTSGEIWMTSRKFGMWLWAKTLFLLFHERHITKAAPSVVSERVDCWLPHRPPANIAHHDRLSTLMSHCGCAVIFQDSLWNLRGVIRSGRPCFPLKKWFYGIPCGQRHLLCHPITLWKNLQLTINPMKADLPQISELILRKDFFKSKTK
jgi:hypothetical protein